MGKTLVKNIRGMSLRTKICIVFMLLIGSFLYQGILKPMIGDTAINTYYFTLDRSGVNVGVDGSTRTSATLNGMISLVKGTVYSTSQRVSASTTLTTEQNMIRAYGPAYTQIMTLTAPSVTIGARDSNNAGNNINWKAYIYDYNPAGTSGNGTLLWTSNSTESHVSVQTPIELTFTNPQPKDIAVGHRLKVVITCQSAVSGSAPRFYWGGGANYSFFTVSEAPYVANSLTVNNLSDYYNNQLTSVTQGDSNIPMLQFDLYSNVAGGSSWTGGKLNKIGTNTTYYLNPDEPGDVNFSIYKDADNDGLFEPDTDTLVGGPYNFDGGNLQKAYTLSAAQTITTTPQRYFVVFNVIRNATYNTTVGAQIVDNTYFTVTGAAGGVQNVSSKSSSLPNIQFGGTAVTKNYPADWDTGASLAGISETGGPASTNSACIIRNTTGSGFPLVGTLDYPAYSCTSVAGQGYLTTTAQADFARLYFRGTGYPSIMKSVSGLSFSYRLITTGSATVTLRLFYVTSAGVRVNAPIASTYTTNFSVNQAVTTSLAGQDFADVPLGARLGIQIGVTANCRIGLGSTNGARLSVQETAAENENVDVGNGSAIANASVYASDTNKVIDSFTLSSAKAKTVNSITVTGNAMFNSQNIKEVKIYGELSLPSNLLGVLDGTDTLIGSTTTISGNSATISGLTLPVTASVKRYIVVVSIGDAPNTNVTLTALVSGLTVATLGTLGENSDSASGTLTILPTTTLSNLLTAEPPSIIIPSGSGATRIDAFAFKTNGGVNDTITSVKVTLATTSTLPAGKVISDYVGKVEVFNSTGTSLGHLTAPTMDDDWQISTVGLAATQTASEYFVEITPKGNQNITFNVKATVVNVTHSRTTNKLVLSDSGSATLIMDQQPPTEPTLSAATGTYHNDTDKAEVDLSWIGSTDASGSAVSYILVRGQGNAPAPRSCTADGVKIFSVYTGTNTSFTNKGLDEGVSYGYRVCSKDSVNNISFGSTKSATASIKNRCTELPELTINPMASHIKAGNSVALAVNIINKDTGVCAPTTFTLSIVGTDANDSNFTTSTFDGNNFIIATNMASNFTKLNITAKPGAVEKAIKTFHVKVAKSSGGETTCPDPVYVIVNKYGTITHSSLQMGTKYGSWGLDYNCTTCHSPNSTNIKKVKNVITTPNGDRVVAFSITSTSSGANVAGVFGNDNRTGTASSNVCEVCHHNARFHQYSASKVLWPDHNNNGDCMVCHPHSTGFKTFSALVGCDDCHGNPPTTKAELVVPTTDVLFPYADNAGSHAKHDARLLKCATCHSNGNHLISAVPDKKLNMGFKINGSNFTGFVGNLSSGTLRSLLPNNNYTYLGASGTTIQTAPNTIMTCNVYCHGWSGDGGYNSEPAWTGINQVGCGSCHAATDYDPPTSGSHHKHTSSEPGFGNGIACQKCHGYRNYSTSSAHINGNVEWDLSTITGSVGTYRGAQKGSTGNKAPTAPGNYGTCTNLYCHSNVQSNNGSGPPTVFGTATWGGTTTCGSCHIEPNTTGGHSQHTVAGESSFDCRICHGSGGDANPLNHGNGRIDFSFSGLGENTHYSYSSSKIPGSGAYGTCYNSNCHGRKTIQWGASTSTPLCDKCHATNAISGGFYGTAGPGSTKDNHDPYVGAHFRHLSSSGSYKYSAKIDCSICHLKPTGPYSAGHMDTPLPAEINYGLLASSGLQGSFTSAAHAPVYNYTTRQCSNLWCHGAGMNSNEGTGPYASVLLDGGTLKDPPIAAVWSSPFLDGTGANDCTKCHGFPPPAPMDGYQHYNEDQGRPYIATECILCHNHLDSTGYKFKKPELHVNGVVNSCLTCHGRPPSDEASLTVPAIGAMSYGMAGAHQAHSLNPSIKKDCGVCHYNYSPEMPSYNLEIGFNAYGGKVSRGTFYGYSTLSANYTPQIVYFSTRTSTTVLRTNNKTKQNTCKNLYCHGGGTGTLAALDGGTNTEPNWEGGTAEAVCGSCHGVTGATYKNKGSHRVHGGTEYGELGIACLNCHGIKENNYHVDGKVEWEFYSTAKRLNVDAAIKYPGQYGYKPAGGSSFTNSGNTGNLAPSTSYGTCQVYCHSDGRGTFKPIIWGTGALNCGSCHKSQTSPADYDGAHLKHSGSTANLGYSIECTVCHYGSGFASPKHINGTIDVIFDPSVVSSGTYVPGGTPGTGTCKNISCHVSDASNGPEWDLGVGEMVAHPATCTGCHSGLIGTRDAIVQQFGYDSHHVQRNAGVVQAVDCAMCHWEGATDGSKNTAYHAGSITNLNTNAAVNLVVWPTGTTGVKTPANRPVVSAATFISYTANGKRSSIFKLNNVCLGCHNSSNAGFKPFNSYSTIKYSWEARSGMAKTSILSRYSSTATASWSIYSTNSNGTALADFGTNKKHKVKKALSAHGNASKNVMANWSSTKKSGEDKGTSDYTYAGAGKNRNVFCYDCHNSHGSRAAGITSSYSSATGRYKGGLLKTTTAGIGGYTVDYVPTTWTTSYKNYSTTLTTTATFNAGASLCNDCHNNANPSGVTLTKPWSVQNTYSSTGNRYKSIGGYWSTPYFDNYTTPSALRTTYKQGGTAGGIKDYRKPMGGHFGSSINGSSAAHSGEMNGLCTPCHDPHGVTRSLGTNQKYAVPLLKGTWMTSPYKEDKADIIVKRGGGSKVSSFNGGAIPGYHIDQNTLLNMPVGLGTDKGPNTATSMSDQNSMAFRNLSNSAKKVQTGTATYTTKLTVAEFAGLCTGCHTQTSLTGSAGAPAAAASWKSKNRVHQTVYGWAAISSATAGTANKNNKIHAFTCSKCHAPHVSRLPRLMVTNCLDSNHIGKKVSGGTPSSSPGNQNTPVVGNNSISVSTADGAGRFPGGGYNYNGGNSRNQNEGPWWFQISPAPGNTTLTQPTKPYNSGPYSTNCHNSPTAGGGAYTWNPTLQRWNSKTAW